jgi:catechol 2,3-dioxygenase-like lactoylglutathione lyase family enzyme
MNPHIAVITIGVSDLNRAKQFYSDLGWPIAVDQGQFVSFAAADGSSALALYPMAALAADGGVAPEGSGFRGVTFNYFVRSDDRVDAVLADAERAGAKILKPAERARWGGYSGHFADPDGYLWKVVVGSEGQPFSE